MANVHILEDVNGGVEASLLLLQELSRAVDSHATKDQLAVLFRRETAKDAEKLREFHRLSTELRQAVRMRDRYIDELKMSYSCDDILESVDIIRRMQLDDREKASRLLLMARETQLKMHEKSRFVVKLRGRAVGPRMDRLSMTTELRYHAQSLDWIKVLEELETVRGIITPAKAVEFLKDTQLKDDAKLAQLHDLERQVELRAVEKELFIQKLLRNVPF
ncbi:hypothetical protein Tco_0735398 [Tanacetum coccineum]